jgi:hypothetical protein
MNSLTAYRVQHGVKAGSVCQPNPRPGIKTHSSPAAFPTVLSIPFRPPLSSFCTGPLSVPQALGELHPIQRGQLEKCLSGSPALIRSTPQQHCLIGHPTMLRPFSYDVDEAPSIPAGRGRLWSCDGLRCRTTTTLLHDSPTDLLHLLTSPSWTATPRQHVDWPRHHYLVRLPIFTTAVGTGADFWSASRPMEKIPHVQRPHSSTTQ